MAQIFKPDITWFLESETVAIDDYGSKVVTRVYVVKGNKCAVAWDNPDIAPLTPMADNKHVLSRSCSFDKELGITRVTQTYVASYGTQQNSRISYESQSGTENIITHPDFEDLAGTPEKPLLDKAVWVSDNNDDTDLRFVEFKGTLKGVKSYITGTGNILRETWVGNLDSFSNVQAVMGKIATPNGRQSFGTSTSWICAGAEIEPYGAQYRISITYKSAANTIWGRGDGGGWNTTIY
jgi:hypothetical protein